MSSLCKVISRGRLLPAAGCLLFTACCLLLTPLGPLPTALSQEPPAGKTQVDKAPVEKSPADKEPSGSDQIEKAQALAREYLTAFYKHDLETVVRMTNSKLIDSWGGPNKARQVMLVPVQRVLAEGTEVIDLRFPEDPVFTKSEVHEFVLVPTKLWLINRAAHRTELIDYVFGARPAAGGDWTFIEGSRINRANVGKYFRDFPADVPFPSRKLKRI